MTNMIVEAATKPWEKISWSPKIQRLIYRSWGRYYQNKSRASHVDKCYKSALSLKLDDVRVLYYKCRARRQMADVQGAFEYAEAARNLDPDMIEANYEICKCRGEMNDFEGAKIELHASLKKFKGARSRPLSDYLTAIDASLDDTLGPALGPFLVKNIKTIRKVKAKQLAKHNIDRRLLWRQLAEKKQCDVVSILEEEEYITSPIETSRNELKFKVANQHYLNQNWKDVDFLKYLCSNPKLLASPSNPTLPAFAKRQYDIVLTFIKMLHARKPIYKLVADQAHWGKLAEKRKEDHLFRVQHQTHRTIAIVLKNVRKFRAKGKLKKLSNYVDDVFENYICYKTHRIMPCKFEYVYDMLNTLALAHIDKYLLLGEIVSTADLYTLLGLSPIIFTAEPKSLALPKLNQTHEHEHEHAQSQMKHSQNLARLKKRLAFARYPIERAYILHDIARNNIAFNKYDECVSAAKSAYEIATAGNCFLWAFLSLMVIAKSHAILERLERLQDVLILAEDVCVRLRSRKLLEFIRACQEKTEEFRRRASIGSKRSRCSGDSLFKISF